MQMRRRSSAVFIAAAIMMLNVTSLHAQRPTKVDSGGGPAGDSLLAIYLLSVQFRRDHISIDERPLDWTRTREIARLEPAEPPTDSAGGRIVGRIVNLDTVMVRRFGLLPSGKTYIWVQDEGRYAVYISTDAAGRIVARTRVPLLDEHAAADSMLLYRQALARFRLSSPPKLRALRTCWWDCPTGTWCQPDSVRSLMYVSPPTRPRD